MLNSHEVTVETKTLFEPAFQKACQEAGVPKGEPGVLFDRQAGRLVYQLDATAIETVEDELHALRQTIARLEQDAEALKGELLETIKLNVELQRRTSSALAPGEFPKPDEPAAEPTV